MPNRERRCVATLQLRVKTDRALDLEHDTSSCKEGHSGSLMLVIIDKQGGVSMNVICYPYE